VVFGRRFIEDASRPAQILASAGKVTHRFAQTAAYDEIQAGVGMCVSVQRGAGKVMRLDQLKSRELRGYQPIPRRNLLKVGVFD
jgi:hypothetical protein